MILTQVLFRRALHTITGAALLGALVSGCSGGSGGTSALPQTAPKPAAHQMLAVDRANAPSIMAKVKNSNALYMPVKGQKPRLLDLKMRKPMTAGAGNDLSYYGGPTQQGSAEYNILVNASDEGPWGGQITRFENDFGASNMVHIMDQYGAAGTYSAGGDYAVSYDTSGTLQDADIFNIIHSVVTAYGLPTGYGAEYHVFLQSGVQQCSTSAGGCYAAQYCAYHGSNDYTDIGHVLYSTEPYQNIPGCRISYQPSPQGVLSDSTASVLSHEMSETITDADVAVNNIAWYNSTAGEIGDICAPANNVPTQNVTLGSDTWEIQGEYSNSVHDCAWTN